MKFGQKKNFMRLIYLISRVLLAWTFLILWPTVAPNFNLKFHFFYFEVYWHLGGTKHVPKKWPNTFSTKINLDSPLAVENSVDGQILNIYLGSSPKPFCPNGRSDDLSILIHAITSAEKFIYVAVSDYAPMNVFGKIRKPWLILDDLLREGIMNMEIFKVFFDCRHDTVGQ